jgi:Protein of unknown function (DUF1761)
MAFAGINYIAILVAAVAGWIAGAVWYMALAKPWMAAVGTTREQIDAAKQRPGASLPFVFAFAANVIMAWVLDGVISGAFCWLGFVITTMLVNNSFAMRSRMLLLIDGGHWLVVLMLMGAIIGAMGV